MSNIKAVVGLQAGGEGKGIISSYLSQEAEIIIRSQALEGEEVVNEWGKFILQASPYGIFNQDAMNIIPPSAFVNFDTLLKESAEIEVKTGQKPENLFIDKRATVILPSHLKEEENGFLPCLKDKLNGKAITAGQLLDEEEREKRLDKELLLSARYWMESFAPFIIDTIPIIRYAVETDSEILLHTEGGILTDLNYGLAEKGNLNLASSGIPASKCNEIIGVSRAYSAYPEAIKCITKMDESSLGFGYIDAIALDYACYLTGATSIALTYLSHLDNMAEVKICTGYMIEGEYYTNLPDPALANKARPIYETLPGWQSSTVECKTFEELPINAQEYIKAIEEFTSLPISYIATTPNSIIKR